MRLLFLTLLVGIVAGGKKAPAPKAAAPDCAVVLGDFRTSRDLCLSQLNLVDWILTTAPTLAPITNVPTGAPSSTQAPTGAPVVVTDSPTASPVVVTDSPTASPVVATDSPTASPVVATDSPTSSPTTPTVSPATAACAPAGPCVNFMNWVDMWRPQVDQCLRLEAAAATEERAEQIVAELRFSTLLVNKGCGMNKLGETCGDGAFTELQEAGCPLDQLAVDAWITSFGCCVASFAEVSMARMELTGAPPCEGEFAIGKACKAPKWKVPKKVAVPASLGKAKKAGAIAGALVGGVVGLGAIGLALRKRRSRLANTKPQKVAGQVAMTHAVAI